MAVKKKYGEPYARKDLLKYGDIKSAAKLAHFSNANVYQQIAGDRKMHPTVKALLDAQADKAQAIIDAASN